MGHRGRCHARRLTSTERAPARAAGARGSRAVHPAPRGQDGRGEQPRDCQRPCARGRAAPAPRDVRIRPAAERDLGAISALFTPPLDLARLPLAPDGLAHAAGRSGRSWRWTGTRVVGHVGYTLSRFHTPRGELTGLFCVNWVVDESCRGLGRRPAPVRGDLPPRRLLLRVRGHGVLAEALLRHGLRADPPPRVPREGAPPAAPTPESWPIAGRGGLAKAVALAGLSRAGRRRWRAGAPGLALAPYRAGRARRGAVPTAAWPTSRPPSSSRGTWAAPA